MAHYLVVVDLEDGEYDRIIEHDLECPTEIIYTDPEGRPIHDYTCGVGYWSSNYGLMDLEESEDERFNIPGKHEIDFYSYTPASSFEDPEAYIFFVNDYSK